jgi:DNA-binding XRE family transcriptional regulator
LKLLAQRIRFLEGQIDDIEKRLRPIIAEHFPALLGLHGVGPHSAAQLLMAAGDNADRLHSEAAFAKLCGACPQPASSGKTVRFRLDRGGSRNANRALYRIVIVRMRHDEATRRYVARRVEEGKTKSEIIRCLKRFVAREVFSVIVNPPDDIPICTEVREARSAAGVTLTQLAIEIGVTPTNLSRLERGLEQNTKRTQLALDRLADITGSSTLPPDT